MIKAQSVLALLVLLLGAALGDREPGAIGGLDLVISAAFIGFNVTVPANTTFSLSFTPVFDKPLLRGNGDLIGGGNSTEGGKPKTHLNHLAIPPVFTTAGRDEVVNSSCGSYNETNGVFRGKRMCVRAVIRKDFETNARKFLGTANVTSSVTHRSGWSPLFANMSGHGVTYTAHTNHTFQGFYFVIVAPSYVPITLTRIQVTGPELKTLVSEADIHLPPAEAPAV